MAKKQIYSILIVFSILTGTVFLAIPSYQAVTAQSNQDVWSEPTNLSKSGSATSPGMVIDSNGVIHVIWQDEFYGTMYAEFDGQQWNTPIATVFPFGQAIPLLVANPNGFIHAFWTDEQNQLFHSFVPADQFSDPTSWYGVIQLAESAVDFDVAFDNQGGLHVAYLRTLDTQEFPAGIYYRVTTDGGLNWTLSNLVYQSPYFRSLTNDQANVDITTDDDHVYLAWDNRARNQIYMTRSSDRGSTWGQAELVDNPTEANPSTNPINIQAVEFDDGLLRLWQDGDPAVNCTQYYQFLTNGGKTWSDKDIMLSGLSGCPQEQYFFKDDGLLILMTTIQGQVYLVAWDGKQWSEPQPQQSLLGFQDPETFDPVSFGCRVPGSDQKGNIVVVGCDTENGGDIWITSRPFGNVEEWFPPASAWTTPIEVAQSDTGITSPILLSDTDGRLHAFWVQQENTTTSDSSREVIYYSQNETDQWTQPVAVLQSPTGFTRQPSATIDDEGNLYVAWSGGEGGEIYFSRASSTRAKFPSEWVQPILLPSVQQVGSSPDLQIADNGDIYVAYSIPLNERRGIYITKSEDGGSNWSEPILAFDAAQAGWDMIDQPHLVVGRNGSMYVVFTKLTLPEGSGAKGLYAVSSNDEGASWSELQSVVEKPVLWSDAIDSVGGNLMRVWMEPTVGGNFFQYQLSQDQGETWSPASSISFTEDISGDPTLTKDIGDQVYLIQAFNNANEGSFLRNWKWEGNQWVLGEDLGLKTGTPSVIEAVSASVSPLGRLGLIYSGSRQETGESLISHFLDFSDRIVELPIILPTTLPDPVIEPTPTSEIGTMVLPSPTPTKIPPSLSVVEQEENAYSSNNIWSGVILGIFLAGSIAIVVFVYRIIRIRQK
jgi:hypothetical protein